MLYKYDPDKVYKCLKCRGIVISVKYQLPPMPTGGDYLVLTCGRCSHKWRMIPADGEEQER